MKPIVSKKLRRSAYQQDCTMNVAGVCNYNPETTVLAHISVEGGTMGGKTHDFSAVFACSHCHSWYDNYLGAEDELYFYSRRALVRTWEKWIEQGLIKLP